MDFGDILDQWDRQTAKPQGKKGMAPKEAQTSHKQDAFQLSDDRQSKSIHPLTAWLRIYGVYDKDAEAQGEEERGGERRRRLLHKKADAVIDLHGLTQDEAWNALETFFQHSKRQGFEKVLVIHGKGNHSSGEAVLKQTVRTFIERCPFTGESGHENSATGGTGATWVFLKTKG
jgi:DNA-nicking Smr family endonuclease